MRGGRPLIAPSSDGFCLPHEVFELGLKQGPLLVYLYLICRKSLKHGADKMSCAVIGKAVGCAKKLCEHICARWPTLGSSKWSIMGKHSPTRCIPFNPTCRSIAARRPAVAGYPGRKSGSLGRCSKRCSLCPMRCSNWASKPVSCWCTSTSTTKKVCGADSAGPAMPPSASKLLPKSSTK